MQKKRQPQQKNNGFTVVEVLMASVIFGILTVGIVGAYGSVRQSYNVSRQLNEVYTVLSACPEIDRALEFSSLSTGTNCYPNNVFSAEGTGTNAVTYSPTLIVTDTVNLPSSDPLKTVPDSKVVDVNTGFALSQGGTDMKLRLLITRNGVAQQ